VTSLHPSRKVAPSARLYQLLTPPALYERVLAAARDACWLAQLLSAPEAHPLRFRFMREDRDLSLSAYMWNLICAGGPSLQDRKYQIQVPCSCAFEKAADGVTAVLGWSGAHGVFAAFDVRRHLSVLGRTRSIRIRLDTLERAQMHGLATQLRGDRELAVALRPDVLMFYLGHAQEIHDCGGSEHDSAMLEKAVTAPDEIELQDVSRKRRGIVSEVQRWSQAANFRDRVLAAYQHRCAVCGLRSRPIHAARIAPFPHPLSTNLTSNGLALCPNHHRAYDSALITIDENYRIIVSDRKLRGFSALGLDGGRDAFVGELRVTLWLPPERTLRPDPRLLAEGKIVRGWGE